MREHLHISASDQRERQSDNNDRGGKGQFTADCGVKWLCFVKNIPEAGNLIF